MSGQSWVKVMPIKGGQVVICTLCGKGTRRFFQAEDTNYSEALRLAVAYEAKHRMSEVHAAATAAFHAEDAPAPTKEELLMAEVFNRPPPSERELRKRAAAIAAQKAARAQA